MGTPFKFTIDICQPDKGTYAKIVPSIGANRTIWDEPKCGGCPYTEEELKAICPNPEDRVKIYAYDSIHQYEAENEQEKINHENSFRKNAFDPLSEPVVWLFTCQKCLECADLGSASYSEFHHCKCAEDHPENLPIACPGAMIGPVTIRSNAFSKDCLKFYDVYAKVNLTADNWGTAYGAGGMITCPNEGTTQCNNTCNQQGDIQCIIEDYGGYIDEQGDPQDDAPNRAKAKFFASATNSSNGGDYALDVRADFYFKLKPKNK
jgi:5-methylcytosine-specific restriction endonuclease McrA